MWIRSAFWVGAPKPGAEEDFRRRIGEMIPALQALPGVAAAKALWPRRLEDAPPQIHCQILVEFEDQAGVDQMLASPGRQVLRPRVLEMKALFDGAISHIDYQVG